MSNIYLKNIDIDLIFVFWTQNALVFGKILVFCLIVRNFFSYFSTSQTTVRALFYENGLDQWFSIFFFWADYHDS